MIERLGDRLLADEVGELLRPVAAGEDGVVVRRPARADSAEFRLAMTSSAMTSRHRESATLTIGGQK